MSAVFDRERVRHLAELAAISLDDAEADTFVLELATIVAHVEELASVDTSEGAPFPRTPTAWREDSLASGLSRSDVLAQAPRANEEGFAVPAFVPGATK